jgi:hypothetical protein
MAVSISRKRPRWMAAGFCSFGLRTGGWAATSGLFEKQKGKIDILFASAGKGEAAVLG